MVDAQTLPKGENQPGLKSTAIVHSVHNLIVRHTHNNFSTFVHFKNSFNIVSHNPFNKYLIINVAQCTNMNNI